MNTAVFTTKFVLEDRKTITYVTHDAEDGAWQFFSNDEFDDYEKVAQILSLEEIINIDPSILELADMPEGFYAIRESANDKWIVGEYEK